MLALLGLPSITYADLRDDLMTVFDEALSALSGDELELGLEFDFEPPEPFDPVHVELSLIGFAFCEPTDPVDGSDHERSHPSGSTTVPTCRRVMRTSPRTRTPCPSFTVSVTDLFLDLETERNEVMYCGELPPGIVTEPGYSLNTLTLDLTLDLAWVERLCEGHHRPRLGLGGHRHSGPGQP